MRSDATDKVVRLAAELPCGTSKLLFITLVVSALNHRTVYDDFARITRAASEVHDFDIQWISREVSCVLQKFGRWVADPKKYPVSTGTAYRVWKLPKADLPALVANVDNLTLGYFIRLRRWELDEARVQQSCTIVCGER